LGAPTRNIKVPAGTCGFLGISRPLTALALNVLERLEEFEL
jgi:hypothetical protein